MLYTLYTVYRGVANLFRQVRCFKHFWFSASDRPILYHKNFLGDYEIMARSSQFDGA